ncbi:BrnT family toxin [Salmonella enterica]|nr:BrnT family toxin [Salmonella enterica]EBD7602156.1 BrnT family toxin [Salmonella enterica]EEU7751470.1 BrnT family toxin [Salmonella enterica]EHF8059301.1 BrnT family toxin [Salmonella enterica subsp. enterica serovar Oranienburg]
MKLEWDAEKAARNLKKHGVAFEDAALVFHDTQRLEIYDDREGYGEDRWAIIGYADPALLFVVYTVRHEDTIRIISARKANEQERRKYRQANY